MSDTDYGFGNLYQFTHFILILIKFAYIKRLKIIVTATVFYSTQLITIATKT